MLIKMLILLCFWVGVLFGDVAMAASEESSSERKLDKTPTWAVASVCAVIIVISIFLEKILHKVGSWLTEKHKRALFEALEKVKAELMILGFISLLLTFGQAYISKICIPLNAANSMLPCKDTDTKSSEEEHRRRLLWFEHRNLAAVTIAAKCKEGYEPLISVEGLHELHILIFFLAVFHVVYSFITMMLGRLKTRGWKKWEQETMSDDYEFSTDPSRFRLTHETSFVRAHTSFWTRIPFFFYVGCFFRQFFRSVSKSDYLTLRNGFISVHLAPGSKFDFQKYIKRSLEDDFKIVVGVSPVLWASFVVFLLLNVDGWQALFWASLVPLIIILAIGTELQSILTKMALEIAERHAVVQGIPLVQASDQYFWFGRPQLVLYLIHFALFQNAFQITYFLWIWYTFTLNSCLPDANLKFAIIKICIGLAVLFLCSYITLPLYALVTQMGSRMKKSVFDEQTSKALKKWRMAVKKKAKGGKTPTLALGGSVSPSPSSLFSSAGQALHRFKTTGHSTRSYNYEDTDASDYEATDPLSPVSATDNFIINMDNEHHDDGVSEINEPRHEGQTSSNEKEFSFVKTAPAKEM